MMATFNLETCARTNVFQLQPYRCARDDYTEGILLDANENAHGPSLPKEIYQTEYMRQLNRYPDPHQSDLKQLLCNLRNTNFDSPLTPANLYVGVGSDEAIDALIRCFCKPGKEMILTCPPTYGMYSVAAQINEVTVVAIDQFVDENGKFSLRTDEVIEKLEQDPLIKLIYLCSPGNPTAAVLDQKAVKKILECRWNGIVVVDEAYIDYSSPGSSMAPMVVDYPNLVVMQTLSKAFGMAGIRLGAAFASPPVAQLLNNIKAPYNISSPTSFLAQQALSKGGLKVMHRNVEATIEQRARLVSELPKIEGVSRIIGGLDANFLLVEILDRPGGAPSSEVAQRVYKELAETKGVVIRYRGNEKGCRGCLRITVGTEAEISYLLTRLQIVLKEIYST